MKKFAMLLLLLIPVAGMSQNPPPYAAYSWTGSAWAAAASTGVGLAQSWSPPAIALYCFNSGTGKWVAADSSCFGGGGGVTNIATTSPLGGGPITTTGTLTCTTCVTAAASLILNSIVIGGGGQAVSTTTALPSGTTATTQSANDNSTKVATTAYVDGKASGWVNITPTVTVAGCTVSGNVCTVSGSTTTAVTFSVIPGTYSHIKIVALGLTDGAAGGVRINQTFNSDSTSGRYEDILMFSNGSTGPSPSATASEANCEGFGLDGSGGLVSSGEVLIPYYANTNWPKQTFWNSSLSHSISSTTNMQWANGSCFYNQTTAITSVTETVSSSGHFAANTIFTIYGIL